MSDEYSPTQPGSTELQINLEHEETLFAKFGGGHLMGRYNIYRIRKGGFGCVAYAIDLQTGRQCAIKTPFNEIGQSEGHNERFVQEASFWLQLGHHPNVATARTVEVISGRPYLFLEYVGDERHNSLEDHLRDGRLSDERILRIAYDVCCGMEHANRHGEIAHLDLKPANILIGQDGLTKVTDFGLANYIRVVHGTYPHTLSGTWAYAAPEQIAGTAIETRTDIFAFGVILFELFTGHLPYPFVPGKGADGKAQLKAFHEQRGIDKVANDLYYGGMPGVQSSGVSDIISGCLQHFAGNRVRNFTALRLLFERRFPNLTRKPTTGSEVAQTDLSYEQAMGLSQVGKFEEALAGLNRLLRADSTNGQYWYGAAQVFMALGNSMEASRCLEQAQLLEPDLEGINDLLQQLRDQH